MVLEARITELSHSQRERLAYIEFRLYFMGEIKRADLSHRFQIASAAATRDFALYKELAPENLVLDGTTKSYRIATNFAAIFSHPRERVLTALSQGFGEGVGEPTGPLIPCEMPSTLNCPDLNVLAAVSRAINLKRPISVRYYSKNSGLATREIVPCALVDSGLRWHVRAFDRKNATFGDFVLTRMVEAVVLETAAGANELAERDTQWTRIVDLTLVPHPSAKEPDVIAMDFGMTNKEVRIQVRAAMAGYLLRRWFVDCSPNHSINDLACCLWLKDSLVLYGVQSAVQAPGYVSPERSK